MVISLSLTTIILKFIQNKIVRLDIVENHKKYKKHILFKNLSNIKIRTKIFDIRDLIKHKNIVIKNSFISDIYKYYVSEYDNIEFIIIDNSLKKYSNIEIFNILKCQKMKKYKSFLIVFTNNNNEYYTKYIERKSILK
jgi:hypothetical protein